MAWLDKLTQPVKFAGNYRFARQFEREMAYLATSGRAISLQDVEAFIQGGKPLRAGSVLVTFDDGDPSVQYSDGQRNWEHRTCPKKGEQKSVPDCHKPNNIGSNLTLVFQGKPRPLHTISLC